MNLSAIIVAAGSSSRMGFDKLLAPLGGKSVLQRSIEAFLIYEEVTEIIVVCPQDRFQSLSLKDHNKPIHRVDGGVDRHDSVAAGLAKVSKHTQYVSVHDGARPLITLDQITKVYQAAKEHQNAASARPITETVKRTTSDGTITEAVDRENLWLMETPQIFQAKLLLQAYSSVKKKGERVTDEVSAMQLIGQTTHLVSNHSPNIKITYPHDIKLAEKLLRK